MDWLKPQKHHPYCAIFCRHPINLPYQSNSEGNMILICAGGHSSHECNCGVYKPDVAADYGLEDDGQYV